MSGESKAMLISGDNEMFEVDALVALESSLMHMVTGNIVALNLPDISSKVLAKVIKYCEYHVESRKKSSDGKPTVSVSEIMRWDADFVKVDLEFLFDLIAAADALDIKNLVALLATTVGDRIKGYSAEQIRAMVLKMISPQKN